MSERRRLFREQAFARRGRTEPIDGLLRITAPHEWLFLALLGAALAGVLLWAVFGTIERGISASCEIAPADADDIAIVASVSAADALRVQPGMSARVSAPGAGETWQAEVREVQEARDAQGAEAGAEPTHRVRLASAQTPSGLRSGESCSVRIVLSRQAPIRLIAAVGME